MNRLALASFLGFVGLAATATLAQADEVFLRVYGLAGDKSLASSTTNPASQGWVRAEAVSGAHGLLQPGAATPTFDRLTVTREHGPSSTFFFGAAMMGNAIQSATIEIRPPGAALPLTRLTMKSVFVRKVTTSYSTNQPPVDVIELEFGSMEWLYQGPNALHEAPSPVYRMQWSVGKI